jgi:hypothetical protein
MPYEESLAFRGVLRRGLDQYRLTPGKVAPLARSRPTPMDSLGKRLGIQGPGYDPLWESGYRDDAQIAKLVENALARPIQQWRARLALFAVMQSARAAAWRRKNGWEADAWYAQVRTLQRKGVEWAQAPSRPQEPTDPDEGLIVCMHPAAVPLFADFIARAMHERGFLPATEVPQAAATVARAIGKRRSEWRESFVHWLAQGEALYDVGVVETDEMQPEGESLHRTRIVVQPRRHGEPPGRAPRHAEFIEGLLHEAEVARPRARTATPHPTNAA